MYEGQRDTFEIRIQTNVSTQLIIFDVSLFV